MSPAQDVDAYLTAVPEQARAALQKLREQIRAAAPKATETISYRIPTFTLHAPLVAYSASKNHCSLHPMSLALMAAHKDELKQYDTNTATIRFPPEKPLPAALVKKLVKARIVENETEQKEKNHARKK